MLSISSDVYDMLVSEAGSTLKWFYDSCEASMIGNSKKLVTSETDSKLDKMITLMQSFLDRFKHIDARLDEKTDAIVTAQLETRIKNMEDRLLQIEERMSRNEGTRPIKLLETPTSHHVTDQTMDIQEAVSRKLDDNKDREMRKVNIILYRIPEDLKEKMEIRRQADAKFVTEMCKVFGMKVNSDAIIKQYRLGSELVDDRI